MKKSVQKLFWLLSSFILTFVTLYSSALLSATLTGSDSIPSKPLFLQNRVKPNIMTVIDDSGSMDWTMMIGGANSGIYWQENGGASLYTHFVPGEQNDDSRFTAPSDVFLQNLIATQPALAAQAQTELDSIWRIWNPDYNKMYYNPKVSYTPWNGYTAANVATVTVNTGNYTSYWNNWNQYTSNGIWAPRYFIWNDSDSDGQVNDPYANQTLVEICDNSVLPSCSQPVGGYIGGLDRTDCATCSVESPSASCVCSYAEEIQNFANWFQYYRKRDYVVKRALSDVFQNSAERVGLATLWNNNGVATAISDMEVAANKTNLLNQLFNVGPFANTPLRNTLANTGVYFENGGGVIPGSPSPILSQAEGGQCQQNFALLMTDGFWNNAYTGVGNADGDNGPAYADGVSNTLADVAMHYYERDLSALPDEVPTSPGFDELNTGQHMVTYTVSFGLDGTLTANPTDRISAFNWPTPTADSPETIDDLRHAAWNGRGEFLEASDPQQLIESLQAVFGGIADRVGSASNVTFDAPILTAGTKLFISEFNSSIWSGNLTAFDLDPTTGALIQPPAWDAANLLDSDSTSTGSNARVMLTYKNNDGVRFRWGQLSASQKDDFNTGGNGFRKFRYIRGDRNREQQAGGAYRNRSSRLGDIIHSGPAFVGDKPDSWDVRATASNSAYSGYAGHVSTNSGRTPVVYVGSNDGMLHGFRTTDGKEVLAYIPGEIYSTATGKGLHYLSDPNYLHQYYVDLAPTIADANVGGNWKTVLVGGLRGGGRGYYALDVTDPSGFTESKATDIVEWEFTSSDDADLGYSYSQPSIVPLENDEWVAIFGNGYKDTGEGKAKLFIVKLDRSGSSWTLGSNYYKISTGVGSTSNRNGLSTPVVVDQDGNGKADLVYAGDLAGNMWAFDISNANSLGSASARKLFQVEAGQAITSAPTIVRHRPPNSTDPDLLVMFGTGQYIIDSDVTNTTQQAFYGVWDNNTLAAKTDLIGQSFRSITTGSGHTVRVLTRKDVNYPGDRGWYIDLADPSQQGERVTINPITRGFNVWFATSVPSTAPCDNAGTGFLMAADILTGGASRTASFDANQDSEVNAGDLFIDTDGDGEADLALDTLDTDGDGDIDNSIDLDNDGSVDTVTDLDGNGIIDFKDLNLLLTDLDVTTYGAGGKETNVGLTGGLETLDKYAYVTGDQSNRTDVTKIESPPENLLNRVSWEEL